MLTVLSQLQLLKPLRGRALHNELATPSREVVVAMPYMCHEVCRLRRQVTRMLLYWSDMCTKSGCENWDDLFAKYGVRG